MCSPNQDAVTWALGAKCLAPWQTWLKQTQLLLLQGIMGGDCKLVAKKKGVWVSLYEVFEEYVGVGHSTDSRNKTRADRQGSS